LCVWRVYTTPSVFYPQITQIVAGLRLMKTVTRIVVVALIVAAIYFATIGREQFYGLLDFFYEIINAIAAGYLKK